MNINEIVSQIGLKTPTGAFLAHFKTMKIDSRDVMYGIGSDYEFGSVDVSFNLRPMDDHIVVLQSIASADPQSGSGSNALAILCKVADRYKVIIDLDAGPYSTRHTEPITREKLMNWYSRFGFVSMGGSEMRRNPR